MNYREYYELGRKLLAEAGVEEAALDARLLLEHICHTDRNTLLVHGDREVTSREADTYLQLIGQRAGRIPLQHLTGTQDFMGLEFTVNRHVLIPRQDTEILVEAAMKELHDGMRILDMCTGSGCILISLLHYSNGCSGVGADISGDALQVAEENARSILGETACTEQSTGDDAGMTGRVSFICSDLFEGIEGRFDMIVSNPPYIRTEVIEGLMPEVRDHEPRQALDGSGDGLYFYRRIVQDCREHLERGGRLYFEIGHDQAEEVSELMERAGFVEIEVVRDYAGLDRVVFGTYTG